MPDVRLEGERWLSRYDEAMITVFGHPALVLDHGEGAWVWDVDGRRYLDLLGGIAVNTLGHNHPALVRAIREQAGRALHISNFYTSPAQVELAERLIALAGAPAGSGVFFANSGAEANEAAIKLTRLTGRSAIVAAEGAFHGRTTGALSLTHKGAYRKPFSPLLPGVVHVPFGDVAALRAAVDSSTAAVFLEPIQGEAGVVPAGADYLRAAREITRSAGALLVLDEVQTGVGRTGDWFAFHEAGICPDAITLAKGLAGGVPIGALVTFGPDVTSLLSAGSHGSTFGGNPLAAAAGLAVLKAIEDGGLLAHVTTLGDYLHSRIAEADLAHIAGIRGRGLLQAILLAEPIAADLAVVARQAGFLINPVARDVIRLAPPLTLTADQLGTFLDALPTLFESFPTPSTRSNP